jgi:hypothetical protein
MLTRTRRIAWTLALTLTLLPFIVWAVSRAWRRYLDTLSESELHLRVFDHSTAIALAFWATCLGLALLGGMLLVTVFERRARRSAEKRMV